MFRSSHVLYRNIVNIWIELGTLVLCAPIPELPDEIKNERITVILWDLIFINY